MSEFVDAVGQVPCGERVESLSELVPYGAAETVALPAEVLDLLAGGFRVLRAALRA
ncbi:hypothetical protein [Streptomyces sp. NPDC055287]